MRRRSFVPLCTGLLWADPGDRWHAGRDCSLLGVTCAHRRKQCWGRGEQHTSSVFRFCRKLSLAVRTPPSLVQGHLPCSTTLPGTLWNPNWESPASGYWSMWGWEQGRAYCWRQCEASHLGPCPATDASAVPRGSVGSLSHLLRQCARCLLRWKGWRNLFLRLHVSSLTSWGSESR